MRSLLADVAPMAKEWVRRPASVAWAVPGFVRAKPLGALAALVVVGMGAVAIFAPWIAPYDPLEFNPSERLTGYSASHWLGTDQFGRDILSRTIYGTRTSIMVGFLSVLLGSFVGGAIGIASGYLMGKTDLVVQRVVDILMSFPLIVLGLALVATLGPSTTNIVIAIAIVFAPRVARVTRSAAISVRERDYVVAARALGANDVRIMVRHVAPNCVAPFLVVTTAELGYAILAESSLSFLGFGTQDPNPSLGFMLGGPAQEFLQVAPWMAVWPGLAIALIVFGFNLLGDALRDLLDPRLRRT